MSEIEKRVIKGFNVDKATEDQLNDLSRYELVDIVLFFREELQRYKQAVKEVKSLAIHLRGRCGQVVPYEVKQIIQKCEEVNK